MIIDISSPRSAGTTELVVSPTLVRPVRYQDGDLRKIVGGLIGHANSDRVLAAYLWVAEGMAAKRAIDTMAEWQEWLRTQMREFESWLSPEIEKRWICASREIQRCVRHLLAECRQLDSHIDKSINEALIAFEELRSIYGSDVTKRFYGDSERQSQADAIYSFWDTVYRLGNKADSLFKTADAELRELEELHNRRARFTHTEQSIAIVRNPSGPDLEAFTARLLQRDGLTVLRAGGGPGDQGADVIALTSDGRKLVIQCKSRSEGTIGPRVLHEVNGTARQVHGADIAIAITNACFSAQAIRFASDQSISLMDGHDLTCWGRWGDSIYKILGIPQGNTMD